MKAAFTKSLAGFVPLDEDAVALANRYHAGEIVMMEVRRPRNIGQHRLYFKLLSVVHSNLPEKISAMYPTVDKLRHAIAYAVGLTDTVMQGGQVREYPRSMAFEKMDQDDFEANVWNPTLDLICSKLIPGIDREELEAEIYSLLGMERKNADPV